MVPIKYNVRNLVVRKRITIGAALGLALVVFVLAGAMMLSNGIEKTMGRSASADVAIVLRKGSDNELSSTLEDKDANLVFAQAAQVGASKKPAGIKESVVVILLDKLGVEGVSNVTVRGTTEDVWGFRPTAKIVEGRKANPGGDEVVVGKAIIGRFKGLELNGTFELKKNRPVKVVGVFTDDSSAFESEVWGDLDTVRHAFGRGATVQSVRVRLDSTSKFETFKALVEQDRQLGLAAMQEPEFFEKQSQMTSQLLTGIGFMIALFFAIGAAIGATITMNAQVAGRVREIGTLRALGFSKSAILFSFLFESLALALAGGILGSIAALGMGAVKITMINAGSWSEIVFGFEPTPKIIITSMIVAALMGLFGGFLPAIRAARISPVEAMRG